MEAQHTPGPWTIGLSADHTPAVCVPVHPSEGSGFVVAHINRLPRMGSVAGNADANARLIAAAPDMLAALRRVADFIRNQDEGDPEFEYGWKSDEFMDEWLNIGAVIDKAEGRS